MKCPQCGYVNKADANSCNLCQAVLKKVRSEKPKAGAPTQVYGSGPTTPGPLPRSVVSTAPAPAPQPLLQGQPQAPSGTPGKKHLLLRAGAPPIELEEGKPFTFGRQPACSLAIPSSRVSRLHAEIRWENQKPIVTDKNSSNGTFVGGRPVKEHALSDGDELEIGPFHCTYRFDDPSGVSAGTSTDALEGTNTIAFKGDLFAGRISENGITEVLQTLEFNEKTGTLDIAWREGVGAITVEKGVPLSAKFGDARDEEAVFALLAIREGRYTFSPDIGDGEKHMKLTIGAILLEAARRADEFTKQPPAAS